MKYTYILNDSSVIVLDTSTGEQIKFFSTDTRYQAAIDLIKNNNFADIFKLDTKTVINKFLEQQDRYNSVVVKIIDGVGKVILRDFNMEVDLHPAITARIIKMNKQGFKPDALINFISNLYENPNKTAIDELYLFIEACNLPITEDGRFVAYKIVKADYMDIYTGTMSNKVGENPMMPRHMVDTNRHNTCAAGLHFCSKEYLNSYGSSSRDTDRCMLVKINPADVVSIPSDYNNAKGRAWTYMVVGEMEAGWRDTLPKKDFTEDVVVSKDGGELYVPDENEISALENGSGYDDEVYYKWEDDDDIFVVIQESAPDEAGETEGTVLSVLKGQYYEVGYSSEWGFGLSKFTKMTYDEFFDYSCEFEAKTESEYFFNETTKRWHRRSDGKIVKASEVK